MLFSAFGYVILYASLNIKLLSLKTLPRMFVEKMSFLGIGKVICYAADVFIVKGKLVSFVDTALTKIGK